MRVGVVIPTLDEEAEIAGTLACLATLDDDVDVVVADGGSTDRTRAVVEPCARVVLAPRGRARQLNHGARAVEGDVLLFLHADCRLPADALRSIREALASPGVVGGAFHKRFDSRDALLRGARARTRLWHRLGYVFGDQAMFVRRDVFEALGGFREDVRAEDMDLGWRLGRVGGVVLLDSEVLVSARRFQRAGVVATWISWWSIGLRQAAHSALEGPRSGCLSSEPRSCRDSSEWE